jgi:hypothetical protein
MIQRDYWTEYNDEEINEQNTRELMAHFESIRAYMTNAEKTVEHREEQLFEAKSTLKLYKDYFQKLKDVLSTREHIPNKQEAKAIRQEKAKAKKNR